VFEHKELAWQAIYLVNLSALDESSIQLLTKILNDATLPFEFKGVINDILMSHNNGELFNMRAVMNEISKDLTLLLLEE